uniref:Uncharacterized protein n=1 Tax=Vespula pensylvanica TaxID=30213 RepID=A0A834JZJ1_VESPE|nr:hypothetical protein H0235_017081 [Vespula pensylvanica]
MRAVFNLVKFMCMVEICSALLVMTVGEVSMNVITISLLNTGDCDIPIHASNPTEVSHHLYGYNLLRSEHSKLFILETSKGRTSATKIKLFVEGLDLFSYLNSKLVYLEKHLRNQIAVYSNLRNLTLYVMKSAIYMAVTAGEVLHIVICIPVAIKVPDNEECYHELLMYQ